MFKYLKALWYICTGRITKARKALAENQYVMATTYDKAIEKGSERLGIVRDSVAELAMQEAGLIATLKEIGDRIKLHEKAKSGSLIALQQRINALKGTMSKEQIESDPTYIRHKAAFEDASAVLVRDNKEFDDKDKELKDRQKAIASLKAELMSMQRKTEALKTEKAEALADVAIAQQMETINATLAGLAQDTTDSDLADAREARQRAKARASVTASIVGLDANKDRDEYVRLAEQSASTAELDSLLNWGEEKQETLQPAKIAE